MFIVLPLNLLWDFEIYNKTDHSIKTIYFLCFDKFWNYRNKVVIIEKYFFGCSLYHEDLTSFLKIIVVTWFKSDKDIYFIIFNLVKFITRNSTALNLIFSTPMMQINKVYKLRFILTVNTHFLVNTSILNTI